MTLPPLLRFHEAYFERIWGGRLLGDLLGLPVPAGKVIGEAWLISDHPQCESVVAEGPLAGASLRQLVQEYPDALLGAAAATRGGRFPLLLKLIDAGDLLSVQVHPDDADALRLGEPDVGKTEMWHVLHAEAGAELICGLRLGVDRAAFEAAIAEKRTQDCLERYVVSAGASAFVPAKTVHAIGAGLLIAEIQQNSDITYRIYDWDRLDPHGNARELHLEKSLAVMAFEGEASHRVSHAGVGETGTEMLARCEYFAAERLSGLVLFELEGDSFNIILVAEGSCQVSASGEAMQLRRGQCVLLPAEVKSFSVSADGAALRYYVPSGNLK